MGWMGTSFKRCDEAAHFVRISDGVTVIWSASATGFYHATVDNLRAICNSKTLVSARFIPSAEVDLSRSLMTCDRCGERVKRLRRTA